PEALAAFERSSLISPDSVPPLVNRAMVFARLGQNADAEKLLLKALAIEPRSAETNFNLGLLVAEEQRLEDAERYLRKALEADPSFAEAAYNLGILLAGRGEPEGLVLCRKAAELRPDNARYTYTLAFYLIESGELNEARSLLEASLAADHSSGSIYSLLWSVYDRQKNSSAARKLLMQAARDPNLSSQERAQFEARLQHFR
ncbi:MAG: tetratricopeptide repeat protein, partial [Acidobacteriota bacterium]